MDDIGQGITLDERTGKLKSTDTGAVLDITTSQITDAYLATRYASSTSSNPTDISYNANAKLDEWKKGEQPHRDPDVKPVLNAVAAVAAVGTGSVLLEAGIGAALDAIPGLAADLNAIPGEEGGVQVFAKGGNGWHYGLETSDNMNLVHIGNHPRFGIHLALGAKAPFVADLHVYLMSTFPFVRIWRP